MITSVSSLFSGIKNIKNKFFHKDSNCTHFNATGFVFWLLWHLKYPCTAKPHLLTLPKKWHCLSRAAGIHWLSQALLSAPHGGTAWLCPWNAPFWQHPAPVWSFEMRNHNQQMGISNTRETRGAKRGRTSWEGPASKGNNHQKEPRGDSLEHLLLIWAPPLTPNVDWGSHFLAFPLAQHL